MTVQAMYSSASGMQAMETKLDVVANNLANMQTTGFKRDRCNFEDVFYKHEKLPGAEDAAGQKTALGISLGLGSRVTSVQPDLSQGAFNNTGRQLDVAISGRGFFKVTDPATNNTLYTRAGNFSLNANGQVVMSSANVGRLLDPPITIPQDATAIQISADGIVSVQQVGSTQMQQVGQIELAQFINPAGLLKLGENLYSETDSSGPPRQGNPGQDGLGSIQQNALELSNVQPVQELIDLITTQRSFELNSQVVHAGDQIMQTVVNLRRMG